MAPRRDKPLALVVLLENVGHIHGVNLPPWATGLIDFITEEYAKLLLAMLGAQRLYDRIEVLEDARATADQLQAALLQHSRTHRIDQLHLVHGRADALVGHRGQDLIGRDFFRSLQAHRRSDPSALDLRMVYGLNCHGAVLAPAWLSLGAWAVNGAAGVNWLPEPSLSLFLQRWLAGHSFSRSVYDSHRAALRLGRRLWTASAGGADDPHIVGSRQIIFGHRDFTIHSRL